MGLGRCRACGSGQVWRSSVWRYHLLRTLVDSSRRYCGACQERWISNETVRSSPQRRLFLTAACFAVAGVVFGGGYLLLRRVPLSGKAARMAKVVGFDSGGAKDKSHSGAKAVAAEGSAAGVPPADGSVEAQGASKFEAAIAGMRGGDGKAGWASLLGDAASLMVEQAMGMIKGGSPENGPSSSDVEKMDKKQLWDKYGHIFGSKEEAKKTYNDYLEKKKQQEAGGGGEGEAASLEGPPPE